MVNRGSTHNAHTHRWGMCIHIDGLNSTIFSFPCYGRGVASCNNMLLRARSSIDNVIGRLGQDPPRVTVGSSTKEACHPAKKFLKNKKMVMIGSHSCGMEFVLSLYGPGAKVS